MKKTWLLGLVLLLTSLSACELLGEGETPPPTVTTAAVAAATSPPATATLPPPTPLPTPTARATAVLDPERDDWTILIYMGADNDLEEAALLDLDELEAAGSQPGINVLVQLDRRLDANDTSGNWADARRYRVTFDDSPGFIGSELVAELGEINTGDPAELTAFIEWGVSAYPANRYALVLWDHGAGWFGTGYDDTAPDGTEQVDALTMPELKSALTAAVPALPAGRFDLIGFDGCLMGQLDVLQTIQPYADYAVGSEELIPGRGWDYADWLGRLQAEPTQDGARLAQNAVAAFRGAYGPGSGHEFVTMSAVDLNRLVLVTTAFAQLTTALRQAPAFTAPAVADARGGAELFARFYRENADYYAAVDLWHFSAILAQRSADPAVTQAARAVQVSVDEAVIAETHGAGLRQAHGIALYFPRAQRFLADAYPGQTALPAWHDYLTQYYAANQVAAAPPAVRIVNVVTETISLQAPAYFAFEVAGRDIESVTLLAGQQLPDGRRRLLEFDPLRPEPTYLPDGERLYAWRDGVHEDFYVWLPEVTYLSDGNDGDYVVMWPTAQEGHWTVTGRYRPPNGRFVNANLVFDTSSGQLATVWGFQSNNSAPYEISPVAGAEFQIDDYFLDADDQIEKAPGRTLVFDAVAQLTYQWQPLPSGDYFLGFQAENVVGTPATDFAQVTVDNDELVPGLQAYRDPYLGFQFFHPDDWHRPTYDEAICNARRDVLCAHNPEANRWLYVTLYPAVAAGTTAASLQSDTLTRFGDVAVLYEDETIVADTIAMRTVYGYTAADGPHLGVFVTFVLAGTGYVVDLDGPAEAEGETMATMANIVQSWTMQPAGFGLFPGNWARLDSEQYTFAYPRQFEYERLTDGWHLFDAGNRTFFAFREDGNSGASSLAVIERWLATTSNVDAFNAGEPEVVVLGGRSWTRVDFSWRDDTDRLIRGFLMVTLTEESEIVVWAEAPDNIFDQVAQEHFLVMAADLE